MTLVMGRWVAVIAVFISCTIAGAPSRFAADSVGLGFNAPQITPLIPQRGVDPKTGSGPLRVSCPEDASVLLRPVFPDSPVPKPRELRVTMHYGRLALRFTSIPGPNDSLCTLVSQRGALPVIVDFQVGSGTGLTDASQQIAASVTTATLDIIPTRTDIRPCDFALMMSLDRAALVDATKPLPSGTNNCYLNRPDDLASNALTVRWSIPGFEEYAPDEDGVQAYKTRPLTYYTDLNSLFSTRTTISIDPAVIDIVENYIHRTLIKNLPAITPIGLPQVVLGK
jgi:hypothetical protein